VDIVKPHNGKVDIRQKRDNLSSWFPDLKDNRKLDKSQGHFYIESSSSSFSCLREGNISGLQKKKYDRQDPTV